MSGAIKTTVYPLRDAYFDEKAQLEVEAHPLYFKATPARPDAGKPGEEQQELITLYCASAAQRSDILTQFSAAKQSDKRARLASARSAGGSWASPVPEDGAAARSGSVGSAASAHTGVSASTVSAPAGRGATAGVGLGGHDRLPGAATTPFKNPYSAGSRRPQQARGPVLVRGGIAHDADDTATIAMSQVGTLIGSDDGAPVFARGPENDAGSVATTMTLPAPPCTPSDPPPPMREAQPAEARPTSRSKMRAASPGAHSVGTPPIPRPSPASGASSGADVHALGIAGSRRRSVGEMRTPPHTTRRRPDSSAGSTPGSKQSDWAHARSSSRQRTPGARLEVADIAKLPPLEEPDDPLAKAWPPLQELLETERAYVRHLQILQTEYVQKLDEAAERGTRLPDAMQRASIFSNASAILDVNGELLQGFDSVIRAARQQWTPDLPGQLAEAYMTVVPFMKIYAMYGGNYRAALSAVRACSQQFSEFANFVKLRDAMVSAEHPGLSLSSLLIKPVQRVCKYPLLWKEVLKALPPDAPQRAKVEAALEAAGQSAEDVNARMAASDARAQVTAVFTLLDGGIPDLVQPNRLLKADWRDQLASSDVTHTGTLGRRSDRLKIKPRRVFLFSDLVVVAHLRSGEETGDITTETDADGPRYKVGSCFPLERVKLYPGWQQEVAAPSVAPSPGMEDSGSASDVESSVPPLPEARQPVRSGLSELGDGESVATESSRPSRMLARHTSSSGAAGGSNPGAGMGPGGTDLYGFNIRGATVNSGSKRGEGASVDTVTFWYASPAQRDAAFNTLHQAVQASREIAQSLTERQSRAKGARGGAQNKRRTFGSLNKPMALSSISSKYSTMERAYGVSRSQQGSDESPEDSVRRSASAQRKLRSGTDTDSSEADAYQHALADELVQVMNTGPRSTRRPTKTKALLLQQRRERGE